MIGTRRGLPVLAVILTACVAVDVAPLPDPPAGYRFAYAAPDCAPWDGAAMSIYMGPSPVFFTGTIPPSTPYVNVAVWRAPDSLPGQTFDLSVQSNLGAALSCRSDTDCERASSGTIHFRPVRPAGAFEGSVDLTFPTRGHVTGGFHAAWLAKRVLCG